MSQPRIVITGMGAVTPLGLRTDELWEGLRDGRCGIGPVTAFDGAALPCPIAGQVPPYKIRDYIPKTYRKAAKLMCRDIELAVIAADQAVRAGGLVTPAVDPGAVNVSPERFGVSLGAGLISCDLEELAPSVAASMEDGQFSLPRYGREGLEHVTPLWLLKYLPNMLACHLSILHDLQGPSNTLTCAEVAGLLAVTEAAQTLQRGDSERALAGAAEAKVNPHSLLRQSKIGRAARSGHDDPAHACRPFDAAATGSVFGEAGAIVLLERADLAAERGAPVLAELAGCGQGMSLHADLAHLEPDGRGLALAISQALDDAGMEPADLDLIIPHGTGIPEDDAAEAQALGAALGAALTEIPVWATKGQISNTGAAAGVVDTIAALCAMQHDTIPATLNCDTPAPACAALRIGRATRRGPVRAALVCSYTYGGHCAALVLKNPHA